jgi:hypothetical protein
VLSMLRDEAKSAVHRLDAIMAASET